MTWPTLRTFPNTPTARPGRGMIRWNIVNPTPALIAKNHALRACSASNDTGPTATNTTPR